MWNRGGKDLDLTSPRAKTWKYRTVETGKISVPHTPELRPINTTAASRRTSSGPSTVASAEDAEVLGRFNTLGKIGLGLSAVVALVVLGVFGEWSTDGAGAGLFIVPAIFGLLFFRPVLFSLIAGAVSLAKHNGRAIWVEGDRLKAIDWWNGVASIGLDQFTKARFEPAYKHNKTTEPVLLLLRPDKKPLIIGVRHIDTPGAELAERIEALRTSRPA